MDRPRTSQHSELEDEPHLSPRSLWRLGFTILYGLLVATVLIPALRSDDKTGNLSSDSTLLGDNLSVTPEDLLQPGLGSFFYPIPGSDQRIRVWYSMPRNLPQSAPIVFVMHGVNRDARRYRDYWVDHSYQQQFMLVVPEFDLDLYPESESYGLANIISATGEINPPEQWIFNHIEGIFDQVKQLISSSAETYTIYGHSSGAQFIHRMIMLRPDSRIRLAIAANSGWYTLPTFYEDFPYGLDGIPLTEATLRDAFAQELVIMLGSEDSDPDHRNLNQSERATEQGPHRLARGQHFFEQARAQAEALNLPFRWQLQIVEGVGHSNAGMSEAAAPLLNSP